MKRILYTAGLSLSLIISGATITACGGATETNQAVEVATYQCPMDCEEGKTYDKDGICPDCKMELKVVEASAEETIEEHGHSH